MFIKGFDENLKCRGYQFEIGKVYETGYKDDELKLCSNTVFHFCRTLQDVHKVYGVDPKKNNRFCEIEVLGGLVEDEVKCGSNKIGILREITGLELAHLKGLERGNSGLFNTGYHNTGYHNTGDWNTGDWNTGYHNTGNCNIDDWNTCDRSTGFFNTKERTITIFNKDSGITFDEAIKTKWYITLNKYSLILTELIYYTEKEKKNSPIRQCISGYLKKYDFKEACEIWWNKYNDEEKEIIMSIPNFDKDIFK